MLGLVEELLFETYVRHGLQQFAKFLLNFILETDQQTWSDHFSTDPELKEPHTQTAKQSLSLKTCFPHLKPNGQKSVSASRTTYVWFVVLNDRAYELEPVASWSLILVKNVAVVNHVFKYHRFIFVFGRKADIQLRMVLQLGGDDFELAGNNASRQAPGTVTMAEKRLARSEENK